MAKPPRGQLQYPITVRVTQDIYDLVNEAASLDRRTLSDWVRLRIEDAARQEIEAAKKPHTKRT